MTIRVLHERLVTEHGYTGSYKSIQRYGRAHYPRPKLRARRRIETPPGAQGQVDWVAIRVGWTRAVAGSVNTRLDFG